MLTHYKTFSDILTKMEVKNASHGCCASSNMSIFTNKFFGREFVIKNNWIKAGGVLSFVQAPVFAADLCTQLSA